MSLANEYRARYKDPNRSMKNVTDWLNLLEKLDPDAVISKRDLGVYIEFTDGSVWLLSAEE